MTLNKSNANCGYFNMVLLTILTVRFHTYKIIANNFISAKLHF